MSRNAVVTVLVVIVLIIVGWFLLRSKQTPTPAPTTVSTPQSTESAAPSASAGAMTKEEKVVSISSSGFSPNNVAIAEGETVTWVNNDSIDHNVSSAVHPTHLVYPPLNLGNIKPGEKKSLQFPKVGIYKYHDHLNPSLTGSVTVQ